MVNYITSGEASDWMLYYHNIVAFSPELGLVDNDKNGFKPNKDELPDIINKNYKII